MKIPFRILFIGLIVSGLSSCFLITKPKIHMEYTIRAHPADILRYMSDYSRDSLFNAALIQADSISNSGNGSFFNEISKVYRDKSTEGKLALIFTPLPKYTSVLKANASNETVLKFLDNELRK